MGIHFGNKGSGGISPRKATLKKEKGRDMREETTRPKFCDKSGCSAHFCHRGCKKKIEKRICVPPPEVVGRLETVVPPHYLDIAAKGTARIKGWSEKEELVMQRLLIRSLPIVPG